MICVIYVSILKISKRKMISEIYDRGESISLKRNIRRIKDVVSVNEWRNMGW